MTLTPEESSFHDAFLKRGGIDTSTMAWGKDLDYLRKRAQAFLDSASESPKFNNPPKIYFNFIANLSFNAAATKTKDGMYVIGVNIGLIFILLDVFTRSLASSKFLIHVGDAANEKGLPSQFRNYYTDAYKMFWFGMKDGSDYSAPKITDKVRHTFVIMLLDIALDFVVAHEAFHILEGHVDYIREKKALQILDQTIPISFDKNEIAIIQALERSADAEAIIVGFANEVRKFETKKFSHPTTAPFYERFNDVLYHYSFALQTVMRIMAESANYTAKQQMKFDHPHPRTRQTMVASVLADLVRKEYPNYYSRERELLHFKIIGEVDSIYFYITGNRVNTEDVLAHFDLSSEFRESLNKWLPIILSELKKYSYIK